MPKIAYFKILHIVAGIFAIMQREFAKNIQQCRKMHLKHYSFAVYEDFGKIFFILLQIVVLRDVNSRKIAFPGG